MGQKIVYGFQVAQKIGGEYAIIRQALRAPSEILASPARVTIYHKMRARTYPKRA